MNRISDLLARVVVTPVWWADTAWERTKVALLGPRCQRCWEHVYPRDTAAHREDCS